MSKKKTDSPPIPEPLSVDYAPTGRAACKKCQAAIGEGSVRVGRLVRSRFHDGYDTQLYHWRCGCDYGGSLDDFRGWQSNLRWGGSTDDVDRLMNAFGDEFIDDESVVSEYRKRSEWVRTASERISEAPAALLRQMFEANDMVFNDREKASQLATVVADFMLFGKLPVCPTCNTNGLRQEGSDIRCHGWFSASTKCEFKFRIVNLLKNRSSEFGGIPVGDPLMSSRLARSGQITIPEDVSSHKAFKTLIIPKELQIEMKKRLHASNQGIARGGGVSSSVIATLDSEDEDIDGIEPSNWLLGMKYVMCGLSLSEQTELTRKITQHGGIVQEDVVVAGAERTTHLVISEEELFRDPKSSRYRKCNDAAIPIVKVDFVIAATDEESVAARCQSGNVMEVEGRGQKQSNSIINGTYSLIENEMSDRPTYRKGKTKKCPELFLFYSVSRGKWKIAPSLEDGAGHVAINKDEKAESPDACKPGEWEVFDGKEKGFNKDSAVVVVRKKSIDEDNTKPVGPLLRQRKYLKQYVVEGSLGKKFPKISEIILQLASGGKSIKKKRPIPVPGSPILTIDEEIKGNSQIFIDNYNNVYNVFLTKTDASTNVNKFYVIQLVHSLTSKRGHEFSVFRKWGRLGGNTTGPMNGSMCVQYGSDKSSAIEAFKEKFNECTGLDFELRDVAPQRPGRYAFVELAGQQHRDDDAHPAPPSKKRKHSKQETASKLIPEVSELINLIFDIQMIEREMSKSMDIDTSRLPPSALSRRQLEQGLGVLREIEKILYSTELIEKENLDGPSKELRLRDCSSRFYTIVPHCFDRKEIIPVIDQLKMLKKRIRNIQDLMKIVDLEEIRLSSCQKQYTSSSTGDSRPVADLQYEELDCTISLLDKNSSEFDIISNAVHTTHAATHDTYSLRVDKIFRIARHGEIDRFESDPCKTNRKLLWHGSRMSNWASILKNGLKIAPKEAPVTGYMFGKGVYFADSSSKSANYCFANNDEPDGLLVLCDVALGTQYKRLEAQYEAGAKCKKKGFDSTWGVGQHAPLETSTLPDGSEIFCGELADNTEQLELARLDIPRGKPSLLYNEYIVYRESQLVMKYIVHVKFDFK